MTDIQKQIENIKKQNDGIEQSFVTKDIQFTKLIISVFLRLFFILSLNRIKYIKGEKCKKSSTIEL